MSSDTVSLTLRMSTRAMSLSFDPDLYPNVTRHTERGLIEWADLIEQSTPVPTSVNDCPNTGSAFSHTVPAGTVGLFEGALYRTCGIYRPESSHALCRGSIKRSFAPCASGP